jgi:WD40-like Beta Propeller Repeat
MSASDHADQGRPRFPALDPEPDPRPWWHRVLVGVGVVAAAGAIAAAVVFWPFSAGASHARQKAAPAALPAALDRGRILAQTSAGDLLLTDPAGAHVQKLSAIGPVGQGAAASLDGRYLSEGNGQILIVKRAATLAAYPAKIPISSVATPAWPEPFADHDRDLIILPDGYAPQQGYSAQNPVTVVSIATGTSQSLGIADAIAADPAAAGAIVTVGAPPPASSSVDLLSPDSRVELRDAGRPPVVLATARELSRDLNMGRNTPVALEPFPDPAGDKIAVEVYPLAGTSAGIVVLTRTGRVLGAVATPFGVQGNPAWSPSGTSLAYPSTGNDGPGLFIWTGGDQAVERPAPLSAASGGFFGTCIWSPDGKSLLCETGVPGQQQWLVMGAAGGVVALSTRAPGVPLLWMASGSST